MGTELLVSAPLPSKKLNPLLCGVAFVRFIPPLRKLGCDEAPGVAR